LRFEGFDLRVPLADRGFGGARAAQRVAAGGLQARALGERSGCSHDRGRVRGGGSSGWGVVGGVGFRGALAGG